MELVDMKELLMKSIHEARVNIAKLKKEKIEKRALAWDDAEGIADAKKDYVRSQVSELDESIAILEADVELYYNQISILNDKMDLEYLEDE